MSLPPHIVQFICGSLGEIQDTFKKGCKVMLIIDNGEPEKSMVVGDADADRAIELIRHFHEKAEATEQ